MTINSGKREIGKIANSWLGPFHAVKKLLQEQSHSQPLAVNDQKYWQLILQHNEARCIFCVLITPPLLLSYFSMTVNYRLWRTIPILPLSLANLGHISYSLYNIHYSELLECIVTLNTRHSVRTYILLDGYHQQREGALLLYFSMTVNYRLWRRVYVIIKTTANIWRSKTEKLKEKEGLKDYFGIVHF